MSAQAVIGFAGMTHLGLVSGIAASEKGFEVVCFDTDATRIAPIRAGRLPVSEPQLDALAEKNTARLSFTSQASDLARCDVIYVAPDVPTNDQGASDIRPIESMLQAVFAAARPDASVVLLSQIPPGFTRAHQTAGRTLYCQVETLIFGRAVERALYPERTIIGWGNHGRHLARDRAVLDLCGEAGSPLHVLGITASGAPRHPLYVPYTQAPVPF